MGRAGLWPKAVGLFHGSELRRQNLKKFLPDKIYFFCKLEGKDMLRMKEKREGHKFMNRGFKQSLRKWEKSWLDKVLIIMQCWGQLTF